MVRRRVTVTGRVQGVFFRDSVRRLAHQHGLSGWVRNAEEGTVEAVFEGEPDAVDTLIEFCRDGPPKAEVESVDTAEEQPQGAEGFRIL